MDNITLSSRASALQARYGSGTALPEAGPWNEVIGSLLLHRSVRAYQSDALPEGTLEILVAAAQSAATSSNMQTWSVIAVTEPATKAALATIAGKQAHIEQCPLFLVWIADLSRVERVGLAAGRQLEALPYLETFLVAALDAAIAAQNAIVAAESMGLATVYIGALRNDVEQVASLLGLPPGAVAVVGLCVGYADESAPALVKPRLAQSVVLHRERYDGAGEAEGVVAYDRALETFSAAAERSSYSWTNRVMSRMGQIAAMAGRDSLKGSLRRLGFPLR
jgi:nitroreductase